MHQQALRLLIREMLSVRRLPHDSIPSVWGGAGDTEICGPCDLVVD